MQRIQDATAVATLPGPPALTGPVGFFQGAVGGVVTRIRYWWLNMIQEELIGLLTAAGLAIDGTCTVLQAVRALIVQSFTSAFSTSSSGVSGTTGQSYWRISADGFVEQGGYVNSPGADNVAVTFPIPFPSGQGPVITVTCANSLTTANGLGVYDASSTGFALSQTQPLSFYWKATWH